MDRHISKDHFASIPGRRKGDVRESASAAKQGMDQMTISEWLDKKQAEGLDVSQIVLSDDPPYDEPPDKKFISRRSGLMESYAQAIIRFLSRALWTLVLL